MKVTLELDDLKALVFATAAIKQIEAALVQRSKDPFVKPYLGLSDAHNRAAAVMRNAERGSMDTKVKWDEPLTDKEAAFLAKIQEEHGRYEVVTLTAQMRMFPGLQKDSEVETASNLLAKGCLQRGTLITGLKWDDQEAPDLAPVKDRFVVKLTERGNVALYAHKQPKVESA